VKEAIRGRPQCPVCAAESALLVYPAGRDLFDERSFLEELAVMSGVPGPRGVMWEQVCLACGWVWQPPTG
jgi:hypothetical protein